MERTKFGDHWQQGFTFSRDGRHSYGLSQAQNGPCGVLAAVMAFMLRSQMYLSDTSEWTCSRVSKVGRRA